MDEVDCVSLGTRDDWLSAPTLLHDEVSQLAAVNSRLSVRSSNAIFGSHNCSV